MSDKCQKCASTRVASFSAKSSDLNHVTVGEKQHNGYVPRDMGVGGGDYVEFDWCLDCGQLQGTFPLPPSKLETGGEEE